MIACKSTAGPQRAHPDQLATKALARQHLTSGISYEACELYYWPLPGEPGQSQAMASKKKRKERKKEKATKREKKP
jgi:hypothetical protein